MRIYIASMGYLCDPAGTRTQDPYIKSVMLYQLSYGISSNQFTSIRHSNSGYNPCFERAKIV
jgi:hypothetical protein